jgi:hypothetical protein
LELQNLIINKDIFLRFIIASIAVVNKGSGIAREGYLQQQEQQADKHAFNVCWLRFQIGKYSCAVSCNR